MSAIKQFRLSQKWTVKEMVKKIHLKTEAHIYALESGKRNITAKTAKHLEKLSGVPRVVWLYPDEYENPYENG